MPNSSLVIPRWLAPDMMLEGNMTALGTSLYLKTKDLRNRRNGESPLMMPCKRHKICSA